MSGRALGGSGSRWVPWTVLVVAGLLLAGSVAFVASGWNRSAQVANPGPAAPGDSSRPGTGSSPVGPVSGGQGGMMGGRPGGMMGGGPGSPMMGGRVWLAGDGTAVTTIPAARARAAEAAAPSGLHPGEVMQFSLNFYVELKDATSASAAEVLVDPASGTVAAEFGPAMMWAGGGTSSAMSSVRATSIANRWLAANAPGETVGSTDLFPGHFTMDTVSGGNTVGMLSVNAATGAVWYHTWHGTFIAKEDA